MKPPFSYYGAKGMLLKQRLPIMPPHDLSKRIASLDMAATDIDTTQLDKVQFASSKMRRSIPSLIERKRNVRPKRVETIAAHHEKYWA